MPTSLDLSWMAAPSRQHSSTSTLVSKREQRIANLVEDALPPQGAPGPD
jgi:hypothetical protein